MLENTTYHHFFERCQSRAHGHSFAQAYRFLMAVPLINENTTENGDPPMPELIIIRLKELAATIVKDSHTY